MPESFSKASLGEIADLFMGQSPDSRFVHEGLDQGLPFLQGNGEFGDQHPEPMYSCAQPARTCQKDDVLISVRAPVGEINLADMDYCIGRGLAAIRFHDIPPALGQKLVAKFGPELRRVAQGTTFEAIGKKELSSLNLLVPPKSERHLIAQILDTLDTQIRQTEALIAKLERIKQGLLADLLTRGIDHNGQLRLAPDQAPNRYKDSPLGWIPREWEIAYVGEVGDVVTGSTPPSSDPSAWGDALPFFTPSDVVDYVPMQTAERAISDRGRQYVRKIPSGSTLVVCIGSTIGKVGFTARPGATNQQINAVLPTSAWNDYFVFQAVLTYVDQILLWAGLQAVPIVNKSTFSRMLIPQPRLDEQTAISEKIRSVDNRIFDERSAITKLSKEKSGLMDELLIGRVRVTPLLEAKERATA